MSDFKQFFNDEVNAQWERENNDNETRETTVDIDGNTYIVKRATVVVQVGPYGCRESRVVTVTQKCDGYDVVIMPGDPMFHAAKIATADMLYGAKE